MRTQVVESFRWALRFDLSYLRFAAPVRLAVPLLLVLAISQILNDIALGVAAAIGVFICGVADNGEAYPIRARVMTATSVALGLAALIGAVISESNVVIVLVSIPVAALCGFAAIFGPSSSVTGMLTLVVFNLFAGSPVSVGFGIRESFAVVLGGLLQTAFALGGWPFKRLSGIRGQIADVWRAYAVLLGGTPTDILSPRLPGQLLHTAAMIERCGARGDSKEWLQAMITSAERMRLPIAAISAHRKDLADRGGDLAEQKALEEFCVQASRFCRAVARALVSPVRREAVEARFRDVHRAAEAARPYAAVQVDSVLNAMEAAARGMSGTLPIGRRATTVILFNLDHPDLWKTIRREWSWSSSIARHAIRLAIVTPVAWIVGFVALGNHQYWVPLTVAWVTRPGYGITVGRIVARTIGTLIGLALIGGVLSVLQPGPWGLIVVCTIAAYILFVALPVNYGVAVVFVTSLILGLLALSSDDLVTSVQARALGTILGGLLALIASQVGASWAAPTLARQLAQVVRAARVYVDALLHKPGDVSTAARSLVTARQQCQTAIEEALLEPKRGPIPARPALHVLNAVLTGVFVIVAADPDSHTAFLEHVDAQAIDDDLFRLQGKLEAIAHGEATVGEEPTQYATTNPGGSGGDPSRAAFERALSYL